MNGSVLTSGLYLDSDWKVSEDPFGLVVHQAHSVIAVLVFLFGTILNCTVLLLFHRRPTVRSFSNRFVINMTVTHLMSCLLMAPSVLSTSYAGRWLFGYLWCQISGASSLALNLATALSLLLIALDRNSAVSSPLHYSMTVTKRRTGWLIGSLWLVSTLSALPPFVLHGIGYEYRPNWNSCTLTWTPGSLPSILYSSYLSVIGFVLPLTMMTWIYCSMFRAARKSSARTGRHRSLSSSITDTGSSEIRIKTFYGFKHTKTTKKSFHHGIFGEEWKAARTGMIILFSFVLCWFPFLLLSVLEACIPKLVLPHFLTSASVLLNLSASIINPYVYVFRNKATRKYVMKLLRCGRRRHGNDQFRALRSRALVPVSAASFTPRVSSYAYQDAFYTDRPTMLWRLVTYVDENPSTVLKEPCELSAEGVRDENGFLTSSRRESLFLTAVQGPAECITVVREDCVNTNLGQREAHVDTQVEEKGRSVERLFLKFRRIHRDSTTSESTDNGFGSFDSVTTDENRPYELPPSRGFRPPLKRVRSVIEEQELYGGVVVSRHGRRESLGAFQLSRQESSETTMTSSTSGDSQDQISTYLMLCGNGSVTQQFGTRPKPKLVRQKSAGVTTLDVRGGRGEDVQPEIRRNSICYLNI